MGAPARKKAGGDMAGKQGHESSRGFHRRVLIIRLFEYGKV